jgi:hypothetical protein
MKRKNPARGRACGIAGLGMFAKTGVDYTPSCRVCEIPTQGGLCSACAAWLKHYTHMRAAIVAIRALDTVAPAPRPLRLVRRSHE